MSEGGTDRWVCHCETPVVDEIIRDDAYCGRCKKRLGRVTEAGRDV